MPRIRFIPLAFLLLLRLSAGAQSSYLDSLHQLTSSKEDTTQVGILAEIGWFHWRQYTYDSAVHYGHRAIQLAELLDFGSGLANAHYLIALSHTNNEACLEALDWYQSTLRLYRKYGLPFEGFYFFVNVGNCYAILKQPDAAIAQFDSARIYMDSTIDDHRLRWTEVMGLFYDQQNQFEKALEYRRKGWKEARDHAGPDYQLLHLYDLAYQFETLDQHDSAIHYLNLALPLLDITQDRYMEWSVRACLGICWLEKGEYARGLAYLEEAEPIGKELESALCCGNTAYQAKALVMLGRGDEAEPYLAKARAQLPEVTDLIDRRNVLQAFYDVYKYTGQLDSAILVQEQLMVLKDTLAQQAYRRNIADMEVRYATEAKEHQIARQATQLTKQRLLLWGLMLGTLLLISLVILYRRYYREKQRAAALLARQNEQLQQLDQAKSTFFANISHEFRTPLTLIMGPLEEAIDMVKEFSLHDQLLIARRNANRLLLLVEELLDLSRLEAGTLRIQEEPLHVLPRLRRLVEAFSSLALNKQIQLETKVDLPEGLTVLVDGPKLDKIVNNLLGNALKFSPIGSRVDCSISWDAGTDEEGELEVEISDQGPGITAEELPHIFDRYYQGQQQQPPQGGTGIGLALARELATALGGELTVSSRLQEGSVFRLSLPVRRTLEAPIIGELLHSKTNAEVPYQSPASVERPALLVVEDQADMQEYLRHILSPHFYTCTAGSAEVAYQMLERESFDLILSDLMLPGEDGMALLRRIREGQTVFQQLPFIMLTARAGQEELLDSLRLGVDDYLTKPFQAPELIARLNNVLENYRARQSQESDVADASAMAVFLQQAEALVREHLSDSDFTVKKMARQLTYSQRKLERIIKEYTGLTPVAFIREIRLRRAYTLLKTGAITNVSEVGQATGFLSAAHFSRVFSRRFGINPREVLG